MINVFRREMRSNLKSVLIWSLVMFVMSAIGFGEYRIVIGESSAMDLSAVIDIMPRILKVMFGFGSVSIDTPEGWYVCMFLWCAIIAYIHAALLGAGIISKEESDKTSEFLFTKPLRRGAIISGKVLAAIIETFIVVLVAWLGATFMFTSYINDPALYNYVNLTMLCMFITSLIFLFIGLCLSAVLTGRGKAVRYSAVIVLAAYFASVMIELGGNQNLNFLSPFRYFDAAVVLYDGIGTPYVLLSVMLVAVTGGLTYILYGRRDLHS